MSGYISQNTFNTAAVIAAEHLMFNPTSFIDVVFKIAENYRGSYKDDTLVKDVADAGREIALLLEKAFPGPPEEQHKQLTQILYCTVKYNPDGSKIPFRIFNGTLFNSEKAHIHDLAKNSATDIAAYISLVSKGIIPKMPTGWKFSDK